MKRIAIALLSMLVCCPVAHAAELDVEAELNEHFDTLFSGGTLEVQGLPILTGALLARFYQHRQYRLAWTQPDKVDQLLTLLATAGDDGLDPDDYYVTQLSALRERGLAESSPISAVEMDLLYSESLFRYAFHQRFGKVDPRTLTSTWNFQEEIDPDTDPVITFDEAVASPSLADFKSRHIRRGPLYLNVQQALRRYREIAAAGGWPTVAPGATLRAGDHGPRVAKLRQRLLVTSDLPPAPIASDDEQFDTALQVAVQRFQARHGLDADGVVGSGTLAALNVPVTARIDQLRLSLERARWLTGAVDRSFVLVNIAGAEVYVVDDGVRVWERRAMVGRTYRQTPVFGGMMTYLEINPTWTVPPGILRNDILPKVRQDPGYLARSNMTLLDQSGKVVDPQSVDWRSLKGIPYTFRQEPGPGNALGRIKFMFPNPHFVFLHDTPNRELFSNAARNFSSGCIRVEDPFALASVLLRDPDNWSEAAVKAAVDSNQTRRVPLRQPWPVYILYWTAEADDKGVARFFPDVYERDAALLAALDADVVFAWSLP